ncbi:MAG: endonuclease III domain-containing protein, partial [Caulobacteraceae bacterium]
QLIKSSISGRTKDDVSGPAYLRLRWAFPAWSRLAEVPPSEIEALIADVTHASEKAKRLGEAVRLILERTGSLRLDFLSDLPVEQALAWLEALPGVGRKVACAVLNFSTLKRPVMVVDTHVWRVAKRLGLASAKASPAMVSEAIMGMAPTSWTDADFYEFHWLLKCLGRAHCQHEATRCGACPLRTLCPSVRPHIRAVLNLVPTPD